MAVQNSLSANATFTHKNFPQLLKPSLSQVTSMRVSTNRWSFTTSDQLEQCSNPLKPIKSFCKHMWTIKDEDYNDAKHAKLVKRVRELINKDKDDGFEDLIMVDALQRLGIDYHFQDEINLILKRHHLKFINADFFKPQNLYEISLCFRILRHKGFHVSPDVFEAFKGKHGKFEKKLRKDIRGLMELYEASQFSIDGEKILNEAAQFSFQHLQEAIGYLDDEQARMVRYTLANPQRKSLSMFNLKNIKDSNNTILQELAELDFTMVQSVHTMELDQISRWDIDAIEELSYYMKSSFKAVYNITNEIAAKVYEQYGINPINSLRNSWVTLCDAFLVEAKWFASGHIPKAEEYLKNAIVSSGVQVVLLHMFFLLGDGATKEQASLIDNNHGIILSVGNFLRLWDDLGSAQDENQDGHDGSYVKCFVKEHDHCSINIAREHVINLISDTWKCLNKECLSPNPFSENFTKGSINIARMVPLMYSYGECGSLPLLKGYIKSMLCDNF